MFVARIIQALLWLFFFAWALVLGRRLLAWIGSRTTAAPPSPETLDPRPLHRDPICGAHVAAEIARTLEHDGKTYHFCSTRCQSRFLEAGTGDSGRAEEHFRD